MSYSIQTCPAEADQCCYVSEEGKRCEAEPRFWIGKSHDDYSYGCGDHAEDLRGKDHVVMRLSDFEIIEQPVRK